MKLVVNKCYGGFSITPEVEEKLGYKWPYDLDKIRKDPRFIEMIENGEYHDPDRTTKLKVVEIPKNATDWLIDEYDGVEVVYFVVKGKIYTL